MKIYLIGYMGVGKSTIGKRLAGALDLPFRDLDALISKHEERSIVSIFDAIGELGFRQKETEMLHSIPEEEFVLSTGGGTPCQYENMDFMLSTGIVIWLQMDPKMLVSRLKPGKSERPLIARIADEDLLVFIKENLEMRYPYYSQANIHFNAAHFNSDRVKVLVEQVNTYSK